MAVNDPIWVDGEVKLINASGDTDLEGLWIEGEIVLYGEYVSACTWDDDFTGTNGDAPNTTKWVEEDPDNLLDIQSNKLNFDYTGTAFKYGEVVSNWYFPADEDFELTVDFDVDTLDASDGADPNKIQCYIIKSGGVNPHGGIARGRSSTQNGYYYKSTAEARGWDVTSADASGKFRFKMVSGALTVWFWNGSSWEFGGNAAGHTFSDDFSGEDLKFSITMRHDATVGSTVVDVNADNFAVLGGCGSIVGAGGALTKDLADTINLSDLSVFLFGLNKSDSMSISDAQIKNIGRPTTDTISISDGIAKNVGLSEFDFITMSDGVTKAPRLYKSDNVSLSDNISKVATFLRSLNDTINLSDETTKSYGTIKTDTITMADNLASFIIAIILNLNDTVNLSDDIVKNVGAVQSDTINISDNFNRVIAYLKSFDDAIALSDLILREIGFNKADTVTLSDGVTKQLKLSKSDIVDLSDSIAKELGLSKADTVTLSDFFSSDAPIILAVGKVIAIITGRGPSSTITGRGPSSTITGR